MTLTLTLAFVLATTTCLEFHATYARFAAVGLFPPMLTSVGKQLLAFVLLAVATAEPHSSLTAFLCLAALAGQAAEYFYYHRVLT